MKCSLFEWNVELSTAVVCSLLKKRLSGHLFEIAFGGFKSSNKHALGVEAPSLVPTREELRPTSFGACMRN